MLSMLFKNISERAGTKKFKRRLRVLEAKLLKEIAAP